MNSTQIRQKIHDYVDQADERFLNLLNGMIEADQMRDWWDEIGKDEKLAINEGLAQLERGEGIPHEQVMKMVKEKHNL